MGSISCVPPPNNAFHFKPAATNNNVEGDVAVLLKVATLLVFPLASNLQDVPSTNMLDSPNSNGEQYVADSNQLRASYRQTLELASQVGTALDVCQLRDLIFSGQTYPVYKNSCHRLAQVLNFRIPISILDKLSIPLPEKLLQELLVEMWQP